MNPPEIFEKIQHIELPKHRLLNEFVAGARASARFTVRTSAAPKTNPSLNSIRTLKRRERRAPQSPLLYLNSNPVAFICVEDCCALTPALSPRRGCAMKGSRTIQVPFRVRLRSKRGTDRRVAESGVRAPSPGGEGRGEGERSSNFAASSSRITHHASRSTSAFPVPHSAFA